MVEGGNYRSGQLGRETRDFLTARRSWYISHCSYTLHPFKRRPYSCSNYVPGWNEKLIVVDDNWCLTQLQNAIKTIKYTE